MGAIKNRSIGTTYEYTVYDDNSDAFTYCIVQFIDSKANCKLKIINDLDTDEEEYTKTLEKEIEEAFDDIFGSGLPKVNEDEDGLLDDLDKKKGYKPEPDPWCIRVTRKPKCECGLGTDKPSQQHYEWCCCYVKEEILDDE